MKKFFCFLAGCVIIGTIFSAALFALSGFEMMGRSILMSIEHEQYDQAYIPFSTRFKEQYDLTTFTQFVEKTGLKDFDKVNWIKSKTKETKDSASIAGIVVTKHKKRIPVKFVFVKEKGVRYGWWVDSLVVGEKALLEK